VARRLINPASTRAGQRAGTAGARLGYPTPYLGLFREDSERCIAFMPAAQGVMKWRPRGPALATLVDEFSLALPDGRCRPHTADFMRGNVRTIPRGCCARCGACWRRRPDDGGYSDRRGVGAHRHHAVRSRPALFGVRRSRNAAADLVHATAWARRCSCRRFGAAGSWLRQAWERVGAALSLAFAGVHIVEATSRCTARSRRTANARGSFRHCSGAGAVAPAMDDAAPLQR